MVTQPTPFSCCLAEPGCDKTQFVLDVLDWCQVSWRNLPGGWALANDVEAGRADLALVTPLKGCTSTGAYSCH